MTTLTPAEFKALLQPLLTLSGSTLNHALSLGTALGALNVANESKSALDNALSTAYTQQAALKEQNPFAKDKDMAPPSNPSSFRRR